MQRGLKTALVGMIIFALLGAGMSPGVLAQDGAGGGEIVVDGERYQQDLTVPFDTQSMEEHATDDGTVVYSHPGNSDPLAAMYVPSANDPAVADRYLPQYLGQSDATCPADQIDQGTIQGNGATYAAAGPEIDFTQDSLNEIGTLGDGTPLFGIAGDDALDHLFMANNSGQGPNSLVRYDKLDENGTPVLAADGFVFAGQQFNSTPGAVASLDGMGRIGCAGSFAVYASAPDAPFTQIALDVAGQPVSFEGQPPVDQSATDEPSTPEVPVETVAPATPEPTEPVATPTEEVIPPVEPTEEATAAPTDEPTTEPTDEPTPAPTDEPTTAPTEEPTTAPTEEPAAEPTDEPTEEPAADPTDEPTTEPSDDGDSGLTGNVDQGEEPEALPTATPPAPDPGTPAVTPPAARPTPTPIQLQPQAVVPTLPPNVASPPAGSSAVTVCTGSTGTVDSNGIPARIPRTMQHAGVSYSFEGTVAMSDAGEPASIGCVGPFILYSSTEGDGIYLGLPNDVTTLFAYTPTSTFTVQSQSRQTQAPRTIQQPATDSGEGAAYRAGDTLQPATYTSLSLQVFVASPDAAEHDRFFGFAVGTNAFGEYVPEGSSDAASDDVRERAEALGIHDEVVIGSTRYVLVQVWTPFGTTTNGWLTLYAPEGNAEPDRLLGLDPRTPGLLTFNRD